MMRATQAGTDLPGECWLGFVVNSKPHFLTMNCGLFGRIYSQMYLAASDFENLQLDLAINHD